KPAAIMGTGGWQGAARAQYHLRQVLSALNVHTLNKPEVQIPMAWELFDGDGALKKAEVRDRVAELTAALASWTAQLKK
ncbi:MAG TPA: NAD(P)H-dependent oxidoreductase, partial [Azospirillaceae bacterium]|nr:NAD(P)H-dependent oxidoreductase [Azospirillaceae bacterium]